MLSYIFGGLSRQADQWVNEWEKRSNGNAKRLAWPSRLMRYFAERPFAHLAVLWLVATLVTLFCERFTAWTGQSKLLSDYGNGDFLTFFTGLWSLQATLAALVYPLVIAFVAVLLQRRASAKLSLRLYALDAAIAPAGISALALVAWMTFQYFALPYAKLEYVAAAMAGNILWALYNVLLTGWFLYRTVMFFDDEVRYRAFVQYAVHTALQREARVHLLGLILSNAQRNGQLPKGAEEDAGTGAIVRVFPIGGGVPTLVIRNPGRKAIVDVRMRLLGWGISLWLRSVQQDDRANCRQPHSERPTLTIPIAPGEDTPEELVICRVENSSFPGWLASLLLRHSIVLGRPILSSTSVATTDVLEELSVEALTLLEERRIEAARETVLAMVKVHVALVKAGSFTNSDGQQDHVGLLETPYGWGSEFIHHTWLKPYRALATTSVNLLSNQRDVFALHGHLLQKLAIRLSDAHPKVLSGLVRISGYLSYRLSAWWSTQVEERNLPHSISVAVVLPNPVQATYNRAMKIFVEGWESAQLYPRDEALPTIESKWSQYCRIGEFEGEKLNQLAMLILEAAIRGDRTAAMWLLDSFFHWRSDSHLMMGYVNYDEGRYSALDSSCFRHPWETVRGLLDVEAADGEFEIAKQVLDTTLRMRWGDLRILLVLILLDWTEEGQVGTSFSIDLVVEILGGRNHDLARSRVQPIQNPDALLVRLLNMKVDFLVREAAELQRPDMVAGRIYTRAGADNLASLSQSQFWLLVILSVHEVNRTPHLDALLGACGNDLRLISRHARHTRDLAASGENFAGNRGYAIVTEVRRRLSTADTVDEACAWGAEFLRRFAESAEAAYGAIVTNSSISQERLDSIQDEVNKFVLSRANTEFPFALTTSLSQGTGGHSEERVAFTGISKESLTEPSLQDWSEHEAQFYNSHVAATIAARLVANYILQWGLMPLPEDSEAVFAAALTAQALAIQQAGLTPIVLLKNQFPDWVLPYRYPQPEPGAQTVITTPPRAGDVSSVYSYLNGFEAHSVGLNGTGCYVVSKEAFASLGYALYGESSCVSVIAEEMGDNKLKILFSWRFWLDAGEQYNRGAS